MKPYPLILFFLFSLLVQIILLNMLIAIMSDTFDRVTQNRVQAIMENRLEIIAEN